MLGLGHLESTPDRRPSRQLSGNARVLMFDGDPDAELVARCLRGEVDAFEPLVLRYQRVLYNVACIYSLGGSLDEAITTLEKAVTAGLREKGWFDHDSNLDPLRDLPRFRALMDRLRDSPA